MTKTSQRLETVPASYLTHELRAPVTSISLGLGILQEQIAGRLASDERQILSLAIKNTERLQGLINDIMDYSKVLAGKLELHPNAVDGREVLKEAVEGLKAWADSKGVRLLVEEGRRLPRVMADPGRVVQVLTNLLSNAIKFTPAGGEVALSVEEEKDEDSWHLVFRVRDTGCGIPEEELGRVFQAFHQAASNEVKTGGTGLGLTLARSMVELHGGRIWAESREGLGSTFSFTIPVIPEAPVQAQEGRSWLRGRDWMFLLSESAVAVLTLILRPLSGY